MQHLRKFAAFLTCFLVFIIITPSNQYSVGTKKISSESDSGDSSIFQAETRTTSKDTVTYIRASIPLQIFQCTRKLNLLRCMKLFLLQRMTGRLNYPNSGNLTKDFVDQILGDDRNYATLLDKKYTKIGDKHLTAMLVESFQKFFKDREIKLHFIPGVMVKVVPSKENKLKLSLKKVDTSEGRKHKTYKHMMQLAVPVMVMPAVLLGSFLPFVLPAIKMATIMTTLLNNGALIAAVIYAARTVAASNDEQMIHYTHPGYH